MSNFWAEQAAKQRGQNASARPSDQSSRPDPLQPWWRQDSTPAIPEAIPQSPPDYTPAVALQQKMGTCPACNSGNYAQVNAGDPRARFPLFRCFDCGYPVVQTTSGMNSVSGTGAQGSTAPARQVSQMTVTDGSGHVLGQTDAASGFRGQSNYHPHDVRAGKVG